MSSGYSEKYKHVFGSKNPGVNVTWVRMFSQSEILATKVVCSSVVVCADELTSVAD